VDFDGAPNRRKVPPVRVQLVAFFVNTTWVFAVILGIGAFHVQGLAAAVVPLALTLPMAAMLMRWARGKSAE
jgi:hypothetical protein